MNNPVFWRLVWKEYRMQRAFWISMALLAVLLQLLVLICTRQEQFVPARLFSLALGLPAFYALGCGATLFATEHETGTFGFQRALPISAMRLFFGKLAFAVVSTLMMIAVLWPLAGILADWRFPGGDERLQVWGILGFAAIEFMVWGMFFSLLMKRPLMAAILAVVTASFSIHFISSALLSSRFHVNIYVEALPYRAALAALVALVDVWLGYRWFGEGASLSRGMRLPSSREEGTRHVAYVDPGVPPARVAVLGRLVWHHWRQSARMMAVLAAMLVPLVLSAGWLLGCQVSDYRDRSHDVDPFFAIMSVLLAAVAAPLLGSCVFLADQQRHGFRFFTNRGIRPRYVWLSRQVVWITALLAGGIVALLAELTFVEGQSGGRGLRGVHELTVLGTFAGYIVLAYLCGQLCSMSCCWRPGCGHPIGCWSATAFAHGSGPPWYWPCPRWPYSRRCRCIGCTRSPPSIRVSRPRSMPGRSPRRKRRPSKSIGRRWLRTCG
jgi:ABC-type transport system involved in multi-copper enzyme maturation permease subunit